MKKNLDPRFHGDDKRRSIFLKTHVYSAVMTLLLFGGCLLFETHSAFAAAAATTLTNPMGSEDIQKVVGEILKGVLGLTGTIALVMFVYGGFQWLFARGDPGDVKKGLDTMLWAGLGLVVIFGSFAVLQRVFQVIPH